MVPRQIEAPTGPLLNGVIIRWRETRVNRTAPRGLHVGRSGADRKSEPRTAQDDRAWYDPRGFGWEAFCWRRSRSRSGSGSCAPAVVWLFVAAGAGDHPAGGPDGRGDRAARRTARPGIGGLLNATFGNAAELIIALFALFNGLDDVVKASLTGSIIGNLLLVLGASLLAGGLKYPTQRFNKTAAGVGVDDDGAGGDRPARPGDLPRPA